MLTLTTAKLTTVSHIHHVLLASYIFTQFKVTWTITELKTFFTDFEWLNISILHFNCLCR